MFEPLTQFLQFVKDLLPRPVLVKSTEVGVCILFGRWWPRKITPRWSIVWEIFEEWQVYPAIEQTVETPVFYVEGGTSPQPKTYRVELSIDWEISNPLLYHRSQQDGEQLIVTAARGVAGEAIGWNGSDGILTDKLSHILTGRGIKINRVRLTSCCRFRLFRLAEEEDAPEPEEGWI